MAKPVLIGNAVDAISKNGVVMLNIAFKGEGTIPANQSAFLETFGEFLKTNGEGIYGSRPWKIFDGLTIQLPKTLSDLPVTGFKLTLKLPGNREPIP